ncbi:MAG: ABC transporter permease [Thiotrichales bacterium]
MRLRDQLWLIGQSLAAQRRRTFLTSLGITIGIASVVLLTALGKGLQQYLLNEFTQFGTHLLSVTPGKTSTFGIPGAILATVRPLTLDDARALRNLAGVEAITPVIQGNAKAEFGQRGRRTTVMGVGPEALQVWRFKLAYGRFLPADDLAHPRAFAVLGAKVSEALFPNRSALGEKVRVAGESYRVIGVMEAKGQLLGFDLDDAIYLPAARALSLFNRDGLMEINVLYRADLAPAQISARVRERLLERHGREDFTLTSQTEILATLDDILGILTAAVASIGGISLLVGAVGILSTMVIAVRERTPEIGLMRAIGARRTQIMGLFIGEAVAIAALGGFSGLLLGIGCAELIALLSPVPSELSWLFVLLTLAVTLLIGLLSGVLPALRAARLQPLDALRDE